MDDLIRRSDVIGLLEDMLLFGEYDIIASSFSKADEEKAYQAINDIPAVNRWIPCSERLPEEETDVIAVIDGCSREAFYSDSSFIGSNFYRNAEEVTYWMPKPKPPEKMNVDDTNIIKTEV